MAATTLPEAFEVAPATATDSFLGEFPDWWEGRRVFGGMLVAQSLRAAQHTVAPSLPVHSAHVTFLRPVESGSVAHYAVERTRDGRTFTTRRVTMAVDGKTSLLMTCSFHAPEAGDEYQRPMPAVPGPDAVDSFDMGIPIDIRELGPSEQRPDGSFEATRRVWLRTRDPLGDDPAIHACFLAYLSDLTGSAFRPRSLGTWGTHTDASLDHAVWFHRPVRADGWLLFELEAVVNTAGRAAVRGQLFTADGVLHTSMAQELLIRLLDEPRAVSFPIRPPGPASPS